MANSCSFKRYWISIQIVLALIVAQSLSLLASASASQAHAHFNHVRRHAARHESGQQLGQILANIEPLTSTLPTDSQALPARSDVAINATVMDACRELQENKSAHARVLFFGALDYVASADHYMSSSLEWPACVFRPATPDDLAKAMQLIAERRIKFAVSCGKHTGNQGFSSTKGIQIDMRLFSHVNLSPDGSSVDVGGGNIWDNVYDALQGTGRYAMGGRVTGVGVGGFLLGGGGYSYLVNQFGLAADSILQFDMVSPDGRLLTVSAESDPDLFFAVKGGGNQFGIVHNFRLKTFPISKTIWGGSRFYLGTDKAQNLTKAVYEFLSNNKDPKAVLIPSFNFYFNTSFFSPLVFYDGPEPPPGTFSMFDGPKPLVDNWGPSTLTEILRQSGANMSAELRGCFHTVSLQHYSQAIVDMCVSEGTRLSADDTHSGIFFSLVPENAMQGYGAYANLGSSPFPYYKSPQPMSFYFGWLNPADDDYFHAEIKRVAAKVARQARAEGQQIDDLALYPNYALADSPAERLFGPENAERMGQLKRKYDPRDTMRLAGSFVY